MLSGWKLAPARLFGDKSAHPSASPPLSPIIPSQAPPPAALLSPLPSETSEKPGLFSTVLSSITHARRHESKDDAEFEKLVAQFGLYTNRITAVVSAVEKCKGLFAALLAALQQVSAAYDTLGAPLSLEESIAGKCVNEHSAITAEVVASLMQGINAAYVEFAISPLQKILASHAEINNRILERQKQKQQYDKAAKSFGKLQKQAAKSSRKAKRPKQRDNPLSAAWHRFTSSTGEASGHPSQTPQQSELDETVDTVDGDDGDTFDKDTFDKDTEGSSVTEEVAAAPGEESPARKVADARAVAASNLAAHFAATTALTEVLKEKLQHTMQRREMVCRHSSLAVFQTHCAAIQGLCSTIQPRMRDLPDQLVFDASNLQNFLSDVSARLSRAHEAADGGEGAWFDEGAASRARVRADRAQTRKRKQHTAVQRRVALMEAGVGAVDVLPVSDNGVARMVLGRNEWMCEIASFLGVKDVARLSLVCKGWKTLVNEKPDVWLAAIRQATPHIPERAAHLSASTYPQLCAAHISHFEACAVKRLKLWKRALAVDGLPVAKWSVVSLYSNGSSSVPFTPMSRDEFNALVQIAKAESAVGAKQDASALADGDLVYSGGDGEEAVCRWAGMIEQDVLRSYPQHSTFGCSSAVARALKWLEERHEDAQGNPLPVGMGAFVSGAADAVTDNAAVPEADTATADAADDAIEARQTMLRNVLLAIAASEPALRYTQGMSSIARMLLEVCLAGGGTEVDAFNMFSVLLRLGNAHPHRAGHAEDINVRSQGLAALFSHDNANLRMKLFQAEWLLARHLPDVARPLLNERLAASAYGSSWLLTLFANFSALPLASVAHVWDAFMLGGWAEIMDAFLFVLHDMYDALEGQPMEELLRRLGAPLAFASRGTAGHALVTHISGDVNQRQHALNELEVRYFEHPTLLSQHRE